MGSFILLLVALLLWSVSLFLVGEAGKSQHWATSGRSGPPEPYSGVAMSQVLSCLFVVLWIARAYFTFRPGADLRRFISHLLSRPELLAPGFLFAVFPPLIVGLVKLATALVVDRGDSESAAERRNRRWIGSVLVFFHLTVALAAALLVHRFVE
ncbi:MAG TPA: hypothetical protein VNN77_19735 [candidate division Zixibacteria bacterium]|nr:hypothetical protein [candidate division Zixibacteria bacterium]